MLTVKVESKEIVGWIDSRLATLEDKEKAAWQRLRHYFDGRPFAVQELSIDDFMKLHHGEPESDLASEHVAPPTLPNPLTEADTGADAPAQAEASVAAEAPSGASDEVSSEAVTLADAATN